MSYLSNARKYVNDGVRGFFNSLGNAVNIPYKLGDIFTKEIGSDNKAVKCGAILAAAGAAAGCTMVDRNDFAMRDVCQERGLECMLDNDGKLKGDLSKEVKDGLLNIHKIKYIHDAMRFYHGGERLTDRRLEALGLTSTYGLDEIAVYSRGLLKIEELRKKKKANATGSGDGDNDLNTTRLGLLDSDEFLAASDAERDIRNYRIGAATKLIYNSLVCGPLFTGRGLKDIYENDVLKHIVDRFPHGEMETLENGETGFSPGEMEMLEEYAGRIKTQVELGQISPNIADMIAREIFGIPFIPYSLVKGVVEGVPLLGEIPGCPVGKKDAIGKLLTFRPGKGYEIVADRFKKNSVLEAIAENLGNAAWYIAPFWSQLSGNDTGNEKADEAGRGGREGSPDVGGR